ncbi:MAG: hypothetical protein WC655_25165 [Candidatus Hydrogenedentales bacterium]
MELVIALLIVAASVAYVLWSIGRSWYGKSCHCSGCGAKESKDPSR